MKTFIRVLSFAQPIGKYAIPFFLFALLSTLFGLLNLGVLIPLLNTLFGTTDAKTIHELAVKPEFHWDLNYFIELFNYYFATGIVQYGKMGALQFACILIAISVLGKSLFYYLSMMMRESMRANVTRNARRLLYDKITSLDLGYFSNQRKGDLISRMTADIHEVEQTVIFSMDLILRDPMAIIIYFSILFYISPGLTLFTLLILPLSGITIAFISKKLKKKSIKGQEYISLVVSTLEESLGALRIIKGYNATEYIQNKFNRENTRYTRQIFSMARTRELASPFSEFLGTLAVITILLYGGSLVLSNSTGLEASVFIFYIVVFTQIITPAKAISTAISNIQRGLAAGERVFEIIDTPIKVLDKPEAKKMESFEQNVVFKEVFFKYEEQWVLKDISFAIGKGKKVALVGETGSGKSTIADLVPRFYDVQKGEILMDGINIKDLKATSIRQHMGIVTQDAVLFNDTIYNNIAFAVEGVTSGQVEMAARIANAHEFILKTEQGYDTIVGDRGMKLSGGQKQRITIARAILKNPPILILDEATSALDTESEKLVQDALYKLMKDRTSLVIAHRLSTIQDADLILVLKDGEIVERGTHQTLMEVDGFYKKLNTMQYG